MQHSLLALPRPNRLTTSGESLLASTSTLTPRSQQGAEQE